MFNSVEYVRSICKERSIPISVLESACGFSNGYLNPKKLTKIPFDRAIKIAEYLSIPVETILTNDPEKRELLTNEKTPTETSERTITEDDIKAAFFEGADDLTKEDIDLLWADAKDYMNYKLQQRRNNK